MSGQYGGTWDNVQWTPKDSKYQYLLPDGGDLSIEEGEMNRASQVYELTWKDQHGRPYVISFVHAGQQSGELTSPEVELVGFPCTVTLSVAMPDGKKKQLTGRIRSGSGFGEGPVGTFTAEAQPGGLPTGA